MNLETEAPNSEFSGEACVLVTEVLELLLADLDHADDLEIINQLEFLHLLSDGKISDARLRCLETRLSVKERVTGGDLGHEYSTSSFELERASRGGLRLYSLELDLMADYQDQGKHLLDLASDMTRFGLLLDSEADLSTIGALEDGFLPEARISEAKNPLATRR